MATGNITTCLSYPHIFLLSLATFIPLWIWLEIIIKADPHPEPKLLIFFSILLGFLATILSYYSELFLYNKIGDFNNIYFFYSAFIEEFFKFLVIFLFIFRTKYFDEPVDAMIYMGFSAIGFSIFETFANLCKVLLTELYLPFYSFFFVIVVSVFRFIGANFLHILASAIIGFGYAFSIRMRRIYPFIFSFLSSVFLHFIYNLFIIKEDISLYIFPILWAIFFIVIIQLTILRKENGLGTRTSY